MFFKVTIILIYLALIDIFSIAIVYHPYIKWSDSSLDLHFIQFTL